MVEHRDLHCIYGVNKVYMVIDKGHLVQDLKAHVIEVIYDREDGDRRIGKCTLLGSFLPSKFQSYDALNEVVNATDSKTLRVWDVIANDWRTLKLDRVISAQIVNH